jgi:2-polyprenyl-3-methyl-5-hydroxy-6-metoxy-1,4-benzoquinol methylase/uncharacterized protein YbaR (Trm112 family)
MDNLRCPTCQKALQENGLPHPQELVCSCGQRYPIIEGVPRFVETQKYVGSFGFQWNTYDVRRDEEDEEIFMVKTSLHSSELAGKRVLDAGCGGGRYCRIVGKAGAIVEAIDLSHAVQKARQLCADYPNVRIVQGDLFHLPYPPQSFDFVYSIGVIHHTPSTQKAFESISKMVKPGGKLAVWVYRKNTWPQEIINTTLRSITKRLPHSILKPIAFFLGAVLGGDSPC